MKKVIDTSGLRSNALKAFLSQSARNKAIFTSHLGIETHKGNAKINVRKSMEIAREFPKQIIILKPTHLVSSLRPRRAGVQKRMEDVGATKRLGDFFENLYSESIQHQQWMDRELDRRNLKAEKQCERQLIDVDEIREGLTLRQESYTPEYLKELRKAGSIIDMFDDRSVEDVLMVTAMLLGKLGFRKAPSLGNVVYSFPFRYSLCCQMNYLRWISKGGFDSAKTKILANDGTDMTYAAFATFFDGVISEDEKLNGSYEDARLFLRSGVLPTV